MKTVKKALTYRALSLLVTAATGFVLTGSPVAALGLGLADGLLKFGLYAAHEAAWARLGGEGGGAEAELELEAA